MTFSVPSVVCCVRFSADGKYLATGCNQTAQIYDTKTGAKTWFGFLTISLPDENPDANCCRTASWLTRLRTTRTTCTSGAYALAQTANYSRQGPRIRRSEYVLEFGPFLSSPPLLYPNGNAHCTAFGRSRSGKSPRNGSATHSRVTLRKSTRSRSRRTEG